MLGHTLVGVSVDYIILTRTVNMSFPSRVSGLKSSFDGHTAYMIRHILIPVIRYQA